VKSPLSCLIVCLSCLSALPGLAGDITWKTIGPGGGGWIQSLACDPGDPNVIYLGCDVGGFYVSRDAGRSWTIHNDGLNDYYIQSIAVHPRTSDIIVLGAAGGIFKSTDGGRSWQWKRAGFPEPQRYAFSAPIGAVAFDPTQPNVLYAGLGRPREGKDGTGQVYKSEDTGETWKLVTPEGTLDPQAVVSDLKVAPDGSYVLVATDKGLYRSADGGTTWRACNQGLGHTRVRCLAIAPSRPRVVYCTLVTIARDDEPWNGGVYRSDDGGRTWAPRCQGLATSVGKATEAAQMTSNYAQIAVDPRNPEVVYVGDWAWVSAGVYKTTDGGRNWTRVTDHYTARKNMDYGWLTQWGPSVECLAISPGRPDQVVFGTSGMVYLSDNGGASWQQRYCRQFPDGRFAGTGLEVTCPLGVVADPFEARRRYFRFMDIGLLISDDLGQTFRTSHEGLKDAGNCFALAFDPTDRQKLWAATGQWGWNEGFISRSTDRGKTWALVGSPDSGLPNAQVQCLLVDPASPPGRRVLYATSAEHGLYRSSDDGATWAPINAGLPEAAAKQPCRLVMDPHDSRHLRVALGGNPVSGSGLYETTDGATTWTKVSVEAPFADLQDLRADPANFDTLYVCQRETYDRSLDPPQLFPGGLFKSTDGGRTWARVYDNPFVSCVAINPTKPGVLYLGTTDHPYHDSNRAAGVWKSSDGGQTWEQEITGLSHTNLSGLSVDPADPSRLYACTGGNGVFVGLDRAVK
jgi:photosystem II stability/assembly factor-like uncharacterized protein